MNRLLGTLFAAATLVACAFAILHSGEYSSMCRHAAAEAAETTEATEATEAVDSLFLDLDTEPLEADLTPALEE